jgi:hypothetical protein
LLKEQKLTMKERSIRACLVTNWSKLQLKYALEGPVALGGTLTLSCMKLSLQ